MVATTPPELLPFSSSTEPWLVWCHDLPQEACEQFQRTWQKVLPHIESSLRKNGEPWMQHIQGVLQSVQVLRLDLDVRCAALCMALPRVLPHWEDEARSILSESAFALLEGLDRLGQLRIDSLLSQDAKIKGVQPQTEVLRKMLLGMVQDVRVVILFLASQTQTLRFYTQTPSEERERFAQLCLLLYASLANRLGIWQLKWELEDLSFRFLEPDAYKEIARMLDERRVAREAFIDASIARLKAALNELGIEAQIYGRPKHIYSIYNKMRQKKLAFSQLFDIRALRVLVQEERDCYTVLGVVHQMWQPIAREFDDYIIRPKNNDYRSLHTAVLADDGRSMEVQIRTYQMHQHAELGVAAHWRYKENAGFKGGEYDEKIALLRNLLAWRDEITDSSQWVEHAKRAALDDTIYVFSPQGRVVDLPQGATALDFAYRLHTQLGHRCRGAKVQGQLVALNTALENGQTVEILTAKEGGPSRDWLDVRAGYLKSRRARQKVRQYFTQQEEEVLIARGRSVILKELQREGRSQANLEDLAAKLGLKDVPSLFIHTGRGDLSAHAVQQALRPGEENSPQTQDNVPIFTTKAPSAHGQDKVLVEGVGKVLNSLSRCCKPVPPDAIAGFITRGRGISIHRLDCKGFVHLAQKNPERIVKASWGSNASTQREGGRFAVDILVKADDRQGLLRDISDVLAREKFNVTAVNTLTKKGQAQMRFTLMVEGVPALERALKHIKQVKGVFEAVRG